MFKFFQWSNRIPAKNMELRAVNSHLDNLSLELTDSGAGVWITIKDQHGNPHRGVYVNKGQGERITKFLTEAFHLTSQTKNDV